MCGTKPFAGALLLLAVVGCARDDTPVAAAGGPGFTTFSPAGEVPLVYQDPTDGWEYMTEDTPVYVEMVALDQAPHPDDGYGVRRVCPNDQLVMKNAMLTMNHGLETIHLEFRGPFQFIRHVSTTSPFPTAAYRFSRNAYTTDDRYYAPAGGQVLLACDGYYVVNNGLLRLWVGHLYGKNYTGDVVRNPEYEDPLACEGGDGGSTGAGGTALTLDGSYHGDEYDPYDPDSGSTECPGGGSGGVDWRTGTALGGGSGCPDGMTALVEFVCIDLWNGEAWVEYACGFATVCQS